MVRPRGAGKRVVPSNLTVPQTGATLGCISHSHHGSSRGLMNIRLTLALADEYSQFSHLAIIILVLFSSTTARLPVVNLAVKVPLEFWRGGRKRVQRQ